MKMLRILILFSIVLFKISVLLGQQYEVIYDNPDISFGSNFESESLNFFLMNGSSSGNISGAGTTIINYLPTKLRISYDYERLENQFADLEEDCGGFTDYNINTNTNNCLTINSNFNVNYICRYPESGSPPTNESDGYTVDISIKPILSFLSGTSSSGNFCENDNITLKASTGFGTGSYKWQYQENGGEWVPFNTNPGTGSSITFGMSTVFGSNYASNLGNSLFFRYSVGNCSVSSINAVSSQYVFYPDAIVANSASVSGVSCKGDTEWQIDVTGTTRAAASGETFEYTLYDSPSLTGGIKSQSPTSTLLVGNADAGNTYYVLMQGEMIINSLPVASGCGAVTSANFYPVYVDEPPAVTFTDVPTNPSCNGGSNGSVVINAAGGSGTGYQYKVGTGSWVNPSGDPTSFTIPGLSGGVPYSIKIKDSKNCESSSQSKTLANPTAVTFAFGIATNPTCSGGSDGSVVIDAVGGSGTGYQYKVGTGSWVNPSGDPTSFAIPGLSAGVSYSIKIRDSRNCESSGQSKTLGSPSLVNFTFGTAVNPTCNGGGDGSVVVNVTGGSGTGYQYKIGTGSWINPSGDPTNFTISGLSGGVSYSIKIKDNKNCESSSQPKTLINPTLVNFTFGTVTEPTCNGDSDGSIIVNASGGSGTGFQYKVDAGSWINPSGDPASFSIIGLSEGLHGFVIRDSNECLSSSKNQTINEPAAIEVIANITNESCFGDPNDGSIDVTSVTGGTGSYTYQWSGGSTATTDDISNLSGIASGTTYTLTVTDSRGCTNSFDYTLTEPAILLASHVPSDYNGWQISCNTGSDGSIDVDVSGGTTPYSYQWSGSSSATSQDLSGVGAGVYDVRITDAKGCVFDITGIILSEPSALTGSATTPTYNGFEVSCNGGNNGAINVTTSGGEPPYSYQWSGSSTATTADLSTLTIGTYHLTITDANSCTFDINGIVLTEPSAVIATAVTSGVSCNGGSDGSMTVTPSGGVGSYEYSINGGSTYQPSNIFLGLVATSYTITVKDGNDCTTTVDSTVGTPDPIAGSIVLTTPVSCNADSDGALSIASATGGTGTLTYLWSTGATTSSVTGLVAGAYSVVVTDANTCTKTFGSYTLIEPDVLEITSGVIVNVSCYTGSDGSIDITVQGGTLPYGYSWDNGSTAEDISGLVAGDYTIIITDARGCTTSQTYTITEPTALSVAVDVLADVSCFAGNDGSVTLLPTGGTTPYEYSIDGGTTYQPSVIFNSLTAGSYTFQVRDSKGCVSSVGSTVTEPTDISITFQNIVHTTCGDPIGSAESVVAGGTLPYSYSWKDALNNEVATTEHLTSVISDVYTLEITDDNGCVKSEVVIISNIDGADFTVSGIVSTLCHDSADGQATLTINSGVGPFTILWGSGETTTTAVNLIPGVNTVEVTDANGCRVIQPVNVPSPTAIDVATVSEQFPSCNGVSDAITEVTGTGGTGPYTYAWDNGQTGNVLTNVLAGDYQVTITDDNLCSAIFTVTVQETPLLEVLVIESTAPTCTAGADGLLEVNGQGGTAPYTYDWGSLGTSPRIESLSSGNYPITIVDANGCMTAATLELADPALLDYTVVSESTPTCNGVMNGFIEIAGTNGTAPYTYQWATGDTGSRLQNIAGGNYEVIITDTNGCTNTLTVPFEEPEVLAVGIASQIDPSCFGFSNGQIAVIALGGTAPYFYNWNTGVTGEQLNGVTVGTYTVNVSDVNGCATAISVTLSEPEPLSLSVIDFVLPTCYNTDDGTIEVAIAGGTSPYVINWDTGSSSNRITSLIQDDYQVTITDNQGCVLTQTISLTGVIPIVSTVTATDPLCYGYDDGAITLSTTGGTGALSYLWNDGTTDINRSTLSSGDYSVTVTDENGCTEDLDITLTDPAEIIVDLADEEICVGGSHRATLDLGTGIAYTWTLDNGFTTSGGEVILDQVGTYTVVATDEKGCFGEGTFSISTNEDLLQADFLMTTEGYVGDTIVIIDISWPVPDNVQWDFEGLATILTANNDYTEVIFTEEGIYDVAMDAALAECTDYVSQQITILSASDKPNDGGRDSGEQEPLITSVKVYPNPTDGQFSVEVDLSRQADINVRMIDATGNRQLFSEDKSGADAYTMGYRLSNQLQPGIYFIILTAETKSKTIRLMVR